MSARASNSISDRRRRRGGSVRGADCARRRRSRRGRHCFRPRSDRRCACARAAPPRLGLTRPRPSPRRASRLKAQGLSGPFSSRTDARSMRRAARPRRSSLCALLGAAYARALEDGGFSPEARWRAWRSGLPPTRINSSRLSKFRALRLLWASVAEAAALTPTPARVHGESAWRMMSARDPFINVMRAALAAFSAGLGGADSVALLPFSRAIGLPDSFARRLARNTQLIGPTESHLGFVDDPAAGAGVYEALTPALCEKAWAMFQASKATAALPTAMPSGGIPTAVARPRRSLKRDAARLKTPMTGVSAHPLAAKTASSWPPPSRRSTSPAQLWGRRCPRCGLPEPFETLRDAADLCRRGRGFSWRPSGRLPRIRAASPSPATFSRPGGFAAIADAGTPSGEELARRFLASGAANGVPVRVGRRLWASRARLCSGAERGAGAKNSDRSPDDPARMKPASQRSRRRRFRLRRPGRCRGAAIAASLRGRAAV